MGPGVGLCTVKPGGGEREMVGVDQTSDRGVEDLSARDRVCQQFAVAEGSLSQREDLSGGNALDHAIAGEDGG